MCGSKTTQQQSGSSTSAPPSWVQNAYQSIFGQAQNTAATSYTPYGGQLVAPVNGQQQTGINAVNSASGVQNPYNLGSSSLYGTGSQAITAAPITAESIAQYSSPYQQQVVNATLGEINNQNQQQAAALKGNEVASGAFGGDRAGIANAALAGQQALATNATLANLNNQNFEQALSEANTQQQTGLQAKEATAQNALTAAAGLGQLGSTAQSEALGEAGAQIGAGTLEQQTQQAQDTANYNQYLQQQAYPFQTLSWLSGIEGGLGSLAGGTSSSSSSTQGNAAAPWLGAGLGLLGLLSDKKVKEGLQPIGKTFDGQVIYKFRYKGDPTTRMGLVAQDVEKKHPDAVHKPEGLGGLRVVDYDEATQDAAHKGHFAIGGRIVQPMHWALGGAVTPYGASGEVAPGAGSWIPANTLSPGHTMPTGSNGSQSGSQQSNTSPNAFMQWANLGKSAGAGLGNLSSSIGGMSGNFGLGDLGGALMGLSRGGRAHYDDGGTVSPYGDLSGVPDALAPQQVGPIPTSNDYTDPAIIPLPREMPAGLGSVSQADVPLPPERPTGLGTVATTAASPESSSPNSDVFSRMLITESNGRQFNPDGSPVTSPAGAVGIAQVMPDTAPEAAKLAGLPLDYNRLANDPEYNKALGGAYFNSLVSKFGSPQAAVAAYNAGPGAVQAAMSKAAQNGGNYLDYLPGETQNYVAKVFGGNNGQPSTALAYEDQPQPSQSGGLGAINSLIHGGNINLPAGLGSITQGNDVGASLASSVGAPTTGHGGLFNLPDNVRTGLVAAGLGIMANPSRSLGADIGQGGLQGINAMQQASKTAAEAELQRSIAGKTQTENQIKQQQLNLMLSTLQNQAKAQTPAAGQDPATTVRPEYDPTALRKLAASYSMVPDMAAAAANARELADNIQSGRTTVQFMDGHMGKYPGVAEAQAGQEALETSQVEGAKELRQQDAAVVSQFSARQQARERLQELQRLGQLYQTGNLNGAKAEMQGIARALGIDIPDSATTNAAAFQQFQKNAIGAVFSQLKELGGKPLVSEVEGLQKANANGELQPEANRMIIGQGLGILDWADKHDRDYQDWRIANPNATNNTPFERGWFDPKSHPENNIAKFTKIQQNETPMLGEKIPSAPQREVGRVYVNGRGQKAKWMGNGWLAVQ